MRLTLEQVNKMYPELTPNGFDNDIKNNLFQYKKSFDAICDWLENNISKTKNINTKTGSYGLKHTCEYAIHHYIPNGIFIAAAIACGYKHKINCGFGSINACFNMSMKDINKFRYPEYKGYGGPCLDKQETLPPDVINQINWVLKESKLEKINDNTTK
jgi:hypothetical protein